jgi:hypothetical protein
MEMFSKSDERLFRQGYRSTQTKEPSSRNLRTRAEAAPSLVLQQSDGLPAGRNVALTRA